MPHHTLLRRPLLLSVLLLLLLVLAGLLIFRVADAAANLSLTGTVGGVTFRTLNVPFAPWPDPRGPYWPGNMNPYSCSRDGDGLCAVIINGKLYQHPVSQAQDGLVALAQYRNDPTATDKLTLAEAEANRLISYHTTYRSTDAAGVAWWYAYSFPWREYPAPNQTAYPPWFSSMAQGEALMLFSELYQVTQDATWQNAALHTFDSFLYPRLPSQGDTTHPWCWEIDRNNYAWLQEYPKPQEWNDTINGMGFTLYGLIDYARTFGDAQALALAQGGLLTFYSAAAMARNPGGIASYSLLNRADRLAHYHLIVTQQLRVFYAITGDTAYEGLAKQYYSDYH